MEQVVNVEQMRNQYAQTLENMKEEYIKNLSLRTAVGMLYCVEVMVMESMCVCRGMRIRMYRLSFSLSKFL